MFEDKELADKATRAVEKEIHGIRVEEKEVEAEHVEDALRDVKVLHS